MSEVLSELISIEEINNMNKTGDTIIPGYVDIYQLDWEAISKKKLTEEFMIRFRHLIQWSLFFDEGKTDTKSISEETCMTICNDITDRWDIGYFILHCNVSEQFVRNFADKLDDYDLTLACTMQKGSIVSEDFLREFADRLDWEEICEKRKLSEELMREFADTYIDWYAVCKHQDLSEAFMAEMCDYIYWNVLPKKLTLSKEFILKNIDKFDIKHLGKFYATIPEVANRYEELIKRETSFHNLVAVMNPLTIPKLYNNFSQDELLLARKGYDEESLVRLSNDNRIVSANDEYIRVERKLPDETFSEFLFRLYNIRKHYSHFEQPKKNPDLDGQTQIENFIKDLEKYNSSKNNNN